MIYIKYIKYIYIYILYIIRMLLDHLAVRITMIISVAMVYPIAFIIWYTLLLLQF